MSLSFREVPLILVWHMRQEVMYPELSLEAVKLPQDAAGTHLGLYQEETLCSVISLFEQDGALQFRKFATRNALQGKGYGTRLLQHVFERAKEKGLKKIWCNARTTAIGLYQKFGMEPYGATWEQHGHRFVKMQIEL